MKKRLLSILFAFMLICTLLIGCKKETYTVTIVSHVSDDNPAAYIDELIINTFFKQTEFEIAANSVIGDIDLPSPTTYRFCGWFTDEDYTEQWSLYKDEVRSDLTLYAKWEKLT